MNLKRFIFLHLFFIASVSGRAQIQAQDQGNKYIDGKIDSYKLTGFWESIDSIKSKIEFVVSDYEVKLRSPGSRTYSFMIDSAKRVSVSGFIANWPPYDCELNLIAADTLEISYTITGRITDKRKYKRKQASDYTVKVVGAMRNVMWKGQLYGTINLDTIHSKENLYGLGPVEYLSGELLIVDGKSYKSTVLNDTVMRVEETYKAKAPFFVYANIESWTEQSLPDSIQYIEQLESFLDLITKTSKRPFAFKLIGYVESAKIHIVNLPKGSKVSSPEDAHRGLKEFNLSNVPCEIIGFFSTEHKAIFTHHDTFLHMHIITADKMQMGHLEKVTFMKGIMKLYLPKD